MGSLVESGRHTLAVLSLAALLAYPTEKPLAAEGTPSSLLQPGTIYQNTNRGFRLVVPRGWLLTETNFEVFHYNDVFLTINSRRADLAVREQTTHEDSYGRSVEFNSTTILQQMLPGEVHVAFSHFDGPGGPIMQPDTVGADLLPLLTTNQFTALAGLELSRLGLRFFKRGHWWAIAAYDSSHCHSL